ncbi:TPA: hypothetical protein DDZ86_00655 [Candidatus Dependentiae bacterium]|nr:MAG: hypothetical protein UW09_C0004G0010 [candidate division TM6 bacterium GW2011_GWF2_43_87]HBL98134.1 hypothetical protein [Candidatus Dependentiae bacterium]
MPSKLLLALGVFCAPLFSAIGDEVLFKKSIADLMSDPSSEYHIPSAFKRTYSPEPNGCLRSFQALFNERGKIVREERDEVLVELSHVFYNNKGSRVRESTYWASCSDVITMSEIRSQGLEAFVPAPIVHGVPGLVEAEDVVILRQPWKDKATGQIFSAGTRFVCSSRVRCKSSHIPVKRLIFNDKSCDNRITGRSFCIPKKLCQLPGALKNGDEKRAAFVQLLSEWSVDNVGCCIKKCAIPFVWGGGSYTFRVPYNDFVKKVDVVTDSLGFEKKVGYWDRPCVCSMSSGFDCSMLLVRAAQICGIPYFCRNSFAVGPS